MEAWVDPGQFIFGRESAAKELKMSPSTVWNRIKKLENMRNLDIESDSKYSIITIINWNTYQGREEKGDSQVTAIGQISHVFKFLDSVPYGGGAHLQFFGC